MAKDGAVGEWSFLGGDEGYDALKRRRAIAAALASRQRGFPKNVGEGLTYLGESIGEGLTDLKLAMLERQSKTANADLRAPPTGSSYVPGDPPPVAPTAPTAAAPVAAPGQSAADFSPSVDPGEGTPVSVADVEPPPAPVASVFPDPPPPPPAPPSNVMLRYPGARPVQTQSFVRPPEPEPQVAEADPYLPPASPPSPLNERAAALSSQPYQPPAGPTASFAARSEPLTAPQGAPEPPPPAIPPPEPAPAPQAAAPPQDIPFEGPMPDGRWQAQLRALAGIESGGSRTPYQLEGAVTKSGDRAQGKYQIMGRNVPGWTKEALGYSMTPEEFRANPNAQDITTRHRFGNYAKRYGEEGAARAWYAGEGGMNNLGATDVHGRLTVAGYGRDFLNRLGQDTGSDPGVGPQGPVVASRGGGGSVPQAEPFQAPQDDQRDVIAAALMAQQQPQQQQQAEASPEDVQGEALLRETTGMRRPGSPFKATASRGDIQSDASMPGLSPLGSATGAGISDTVQQRQRIYDAVRQQDPAVPPPDTGDPVRVAQNMQPGIRPDMAPQWYQPPAPAVPPDQGIRPAPSAPPSRDAIPGPSQEPEIAVPPERPRPPLLGMSDAQKHWERVMHDPRANDTTKAYAAQQFAIQEKYRQDLQAQQQEEYKNYREAREARVLAREKQIRDAPTYQLDQLNKRLQAENQQAAAAKTPYELQQAKLAVEKTQLEIANAQRTLAKPDAFESAGARYERPYNASGQPSGPYTLAPGSPPPKEEMTADQASAQQFVTRVKPDLKLLDTELKHGAVLASASERARDIPGVGNLTVSDDYRRAKAIMTNFEGAFMQRVSGAAVSESEGRRNMPAFMPAVGDTAQDLADKAERRNRFVDAVEASSGPAGKAAIHRVLAESSEYLYHKAGEKPPVKVSTPEEADALEPGTRIIRTSPSGEVKEGRVPRKRF